MSDLGEHPLVRLADRIKQAGRRAAAEAYEDALIRGLCAQGAFEAAIGTIDRLDCRPFIQEASEAMSKKPVIATKRIHEPPSRKDGVRVLVDRLWPRGIAKESAGLKDWFKDLAPSTALRKWYNHDPARWEAFQRRYHRELTGQTDRINALLALARGRTLTLIYAAKDESFNNAVALKNYLEHRPAAPAARRRKKPKPRAGG